MYGFRADHDVGQGWVWLQNRPSSSVSLLWKWHSDFPSSMLNNPAPVRGSKSVLFSDLGIGFPQGKSLG